MTFLSHLFVCILLLLYEFCCAKYRLLAGRQRVKIIDRERNTCQNPLNVWGRAKVSNHSNHITPSSLPSFKQQQQHINNEIRMRISRRSPKTLFLYKYLVCTMFIKHSHREVQWYRRRCIRCVRHPLCLSEKWDYYIKFHFSIEFIQVKLSENSLAGLKWDGISIFSFPNKILYINYNKNMILRKRLLYHKT